MIYATIIPFFFIFILIGIANIGRIINKYLLKDLDKLYLNITYGISFLAFFIGLLLCLNIYNVKFIIFLLISSFLLKIFQLNLNKIKALINKKELIVKILILLSFLISVKSLYFSVDDISGYFFTITKYINGKIYIKENINENFREYYQYPTINIINGIFVHIADFYSTNFFDKFIGYLLIILIVNDQCSSHSNIKKNLLILISLLLSISVSDTASGKIIIIPFTLLLLLKIKEFHNFPSNKKICYILLIAATLFIIKSISITSITSILFFILLLKKKNNKTIKLKRLLLCFFLIFLFIAPYLIYNYRIDLGFLPNIISHNKYWFLNSSSYKDLNLQIINNQNFLNYYFIRQNYLIIIITIINLIFSKEDNYLKFNILISLIIFQLIIFFNLYPDNVNQLRYVLPFYQGLTIFILIGNFNNIKIKILKKYSQTIFAIIFVLALRINNNTYINLKLAYYDLKFLLNNNVEKTYSYYEKYTKVEKVYPKDYYENLNKILDLTSDKNSLLVISRPYLINPNNFKKINLNYIEFATGYLLSEINYPINKDDYLKNKFFKDKKIKFIIFEKNINIELKKYYRIELRNNIFVNENNFHIDSLVQKIFYTDLINYILRIKKIKIIENDNFIMWEII